MRDMRTGIHIARYILALVMGLAVISMIAEGIEFLLVVLANGSVPAPETYFEIRNRVWFLGLKFLYNGFALFVGGWLAARIASRWSFSCVIALALIQTLSLIWGMTFSEFARTTPFWAWIALTIEAPPCILIGGRKGKR